MNTNILEKLNSINAQESGIKQRFGLEYNPFPRSGIAAIEENDDTVEKLMPVDDQISNTIYTFIKDALFSKQKHGDANDKYMSLIVRGEYGSGKTQTLMYIRYLLINLKKEGIRPYVIYIDNPGQKLADLLGGIINQIGVENFRKYLWSIFMNYLDNNQEIKNELIGLHQTKQLSLKFDDDKQIASLNANIQNYKQLIDVITIGKNTSDKKQSIQLLKDHMIRSYTEITDSPVVANYFYDIVSETIGVSKSWDMLISGSVKELDKREVNILKAIVNIVCKQLGYTDFFILIDEFEEITAERLKQSDIDNYLRNLRLLIDRERNWFSVFAMTGKALQIIESYSPPLASRIKGSIVDLKPLNQDNFMQVIKNYLSIVRIDKLNDAIAPFDESGLEEMLNVKNTQLQGSPRFLLKLCYQLLQRAVTDLPEGGKIDKEFVKKYINEFLK